jgi:cation diffusion facilitator CzcD-associated flavoprotein CzcO
MRYDVIVIGGGQSGLATGYYLRRTKLNFLILDAQKKAGGAWLHGWDSLALFSQAQSSSLPGVLFTGGKLYPHRDQVIEYLQAYEERYRLPVQRPVYVKEVVQQEGVFTLQTDSEEYRTKAVINTTGRWSNPYIPPLPGIGLFQGSILHSSRYRSPQPFQG